MPETATTDVQIDQTVLDELVPPPGPRWRRIVRWTAFLAVIGACWWAAATGTVVVQVQTGVNAWGGAGPVAITTFVQNTSRVDIEVVDGPRPRPGLTSIGYTTGPTDVAGMVPTTPPTDPFPLRLEPGESIDITAWYRVTDCQAIGHAGDDTIDVQVRIADGPASWRTTERHIDAHDLATDPAEDASWPAAMAEHACR